MKKLIYLILLGTPIFTFSQNRVGSVSAQFSVENINSIVLFSPKGAIINRAQREAIQKVSSMRIDSSYTYGWDSIGQNWNVQSKMLNHYDLQNNKSETIMQIISDYNIWENILKTSYSYNTNDTTEVSMNWMDGEWQNYSQKTVSYDNNQNNISSTTKLWNPNINDWVLGNMQIYSVFDDNKNKLSSSIEMWMGGVHLSSAKITNRFNNYNNIISSLTEEWTFISGSWIKKDSSFNSYDIHNNIRLETKLIRNGNEWINDSQTEYFYDLNGQIVRVLMTKWDGNSWENVSQYDHIVWANGLDIPINWIMQRWINNGWLDQNRFSMTLDEYHSETSSMTEKWSGSSWVINNKSLTSYDLNRQKTSESTRVWNQDGSKIVYGDSTYYFVQTVASQLKKTERDLVQFFAFQSINKNEFVIASRGEEIHSIELFNSNGQTVYSKFNINQPNIHINSSNLKNGVYILKIRHRMGVDTLKILLSSI
jgi:hypothetical protein